MISEYIILTKVSDLSTDTLAQLKDLDLKYFPTPWSAAAWGNLFDEKSESFILVEKYLGEVRGFIFFHISIVDSFAHLLKILVNPKNRGLKIGKNLLNKGIESLKERGIVHFFLEVEEENIVARNLYESVGLRVIHRKKQFYSNGASAIIMGLDT